MIPKNYADEIKAQFPAVKLLHYPNATPGHDGFGVEWHGQRNAWMVDGSNQQWKKVRDLALQWLSRTNPETTPPPREP